MWFHITKIIIIIVESRTEIKTMGFSSISWVEHLKFEKSGEHKTIPGQSVRLGIVAYKEHN